MILQTWNFRGGVKLLGWRKVLFVYGVKKILDGVKARRTFFLVVP